MREFALRPMGDFLLVLDHIYGNFPQLQLGCCLRDDNPLQLRPLELLYTTSTNQLIDTSSTIYIYYFNNFSNYYIVVQLSQLAYN